MKKRCLVTGASGLLGAEVMAVQDETGGVLGLCHDHGSPGLRSVDLREPDEVRAVIRDVEPDVVIHCAAYRDPDFCENNPDETRRLNVESVRSFCEVLPAETKLVFISSDYVFDGTNPPYEEDAAPSPVSLYGASKVEAEEIMRLREDGIIIRAPLLMGAGPTPEGSGFITQLVAAARSGEPLELDNVLVRFPTWARDVARAISFLLERDARGTYHVSGARGGTRFAWTLEMASILGVSPAHLSPSDKVVPRKATRPLNSQLATNKIRELGFDQFMDFRDVVREVLSLASGT
jgi:dTDP-4-dehydrorhamnose reductase